MTSDPRPETPAVPAPTAPWPEGKTKADAAVPEAAPVSADEQMEQFEKDLKNNDWGHQPC